MENTLNQTLHHLVDYATDKLFSNPTVEKAKDKLSHWNESKKTSTSDVLMYTGVALAVAGAAYLLYKNRDAIKEQLDVMAERFNDMREEAEDRASRNAV